MDSDDRPIYFYSLSKEEQIMLLHYRMMSREEQEQLMESMGEIHNDTDTEK